MNERRTGDERDYRPHNAINTERYSMPPPPTDPLEKWNKLLADTKAQLDPLRSSASPRIAALAQAVTTAEGTRYSLTDTADILPILQEHFEKIEALYGALHTIQTVQDCFAAPDRRQTDQETLRSLADASSGLIHALLRICDEEKLPRMLLDECSRHLDQCRHIVHGPPSDSPASTEP